ncbi:MAG: DNA gyrase inhibitor YacG [Hyphomicrobiales bacterium]|nr:DNA gyrase inhibitor YacG [Hyphomicrobiales bacterium]
MNDDQPKNDNLPEQARGRPCPVCGKPSAQATKPFCSARCQDVDLNRWLSGSYVIPGKALEDEVNE